MGLLDVFELGLLTLGEAEGSNPYRFAISVTEREVPRAERYTWGEVLLLAAGCTLQGRGFGCGAAPGEGIFAVYWQRKFVLPLDCLAPG